MSDMGVCIDNHNFLPVQIDPVKALWVKHKGSDPNHDQGDDKEGAKEDEGRDEKRAKEGTPVACRLVG